MIEVKHDLSADGILFYIVNDNSVVHPEVWSTDEKYYVFASLLEEFVDNGTAVFRNSGVLSEYKSIFQLTPSECRILDLPGRYQHFISVSGVSTLNDSNFKYKISYRTREGDRLAAKRTGPIICYNGKEFLLSKEQYDLVEAIEEFNSLDAVRKSYNGNLIAFDRIKDLSQSSKAVLDKYLRNENVYVPSKLKIEIEKTGEDDYTVVPSIDHPLSSQFDRYLNQYEESPDSINLSFDNNERVRIVFDKKQKDAINKIKKKFSHVRKAELKELVEHPELILDPDACDISEFYSDRVIEIGLYKPKFTSFISPFKSSWIPSFQIEDRINGTSKISFETHEELEVFAKSIHDAEIKGVESVDYKGVIINIDDARQIYEQSTQKIEKHNTEQKKKEVLIIEENDESLGYSEFSSPSLGAKTFDFHSIPRLKTEYSLKQHQIEGVAWLQYLIEKGQKGCLLADDMGLGKTLQILSLIDWYDSQYSHNDKPYLIIAPISLLENWELEYSRFFIKPRIKVLPVHAHDLKTFDKGIDKNLINILQRRQIVLTNYETLRSYQFSFCAVDFSIIVLDEAQKIKTPGTMVTSAAKALKGDFKIAMTGTPVENTLVDLWCIMDFALPGLLGNCKEFTRKYQGGSANEDSDIVAYGNEIRKSMGSYFMRRLKSGALTGLPSKSINKVSQEMPKQQLDLYLNAISEALVEKNSICPAKGYMLVCLQKLREISDHPYLGDSNINSYSVDELIQSSAKLKAVIPILDEIRARGEKVIVFAERRDTQKIIKRVVRYLYGIDSHIINGETPSTQSRFVSSGRLSRQQAIDNFQSRNGFNVIVMSPIAAGMGLNVTGANNVIHYSRHWNPAKEEQATDRVYRIGQEKDVNVYYPMAVSEGMSTFDQTLDKLLQKKSELANATLFPTERVEVNSEELFNALVMS